MMTTRLVIIAVGNPSRADDALGPLLLDRISSTFPDLHTFSDFQLQVEHALDLQSAGQVLFIDAATGLDQPFIFSEIKPQTGNALLSHALSPPAVLEVLQRITGQTAPPSFVLAVRGAEFELGQPLSDQGAAALQAAWQFIRPLLAQPEVGNWRAHTLPENPCRQI